MERDLPLKFLTMASRVVRILITAMLIPVLTGIGMAPCTAMSQSSSMHGTTARAVPPVSREPSRHTGSDQTKAPLRQHSHDPCDSSTGMNCCPAVSGCSAVALPSIVAAAQAVTATVASVHIGYDELPIAWAVAPEPPPPKA